MESSSDDEDEGGYFRSYYKDKEYDEPSVYLKKMKLNEEEIFQSRPDECYDENQEEYEKQIEEEPVRFGFFSILFLKWTMLL